MMETNSLPLSGVRVLELATVVAVPTAGRILATYGAEVIKIETPPEGDLIRPMGMGHQMYIDPVHNPLFDMVNSGKKLTAVDLKTEEGMQVFERLLGESDVLLSNVRMRSLKKMGLDYDSLKERFPHLIYAHFSGFGLEGADSELPGFDTTAFWMRSGAAEGSVLPGSYPLRPSFGFGDICSASMLLTGVLMALYAKEKTGKGTMVNTSLYGCGIWANSTAVINSQPGFNKRYPLDRYDAWDPFSECYLCADGKWIAFMETRYAKDKYFFAELFDLPELLSEPEFENLKTMFDSGKIPSIVRRVEDHMRTKTSDEWNRIFNENNIPNQILRNFDEVHNDEQAWANGYLQKMDYPGHAGTAMPMPPLHFSAYGQRGFEACGLVGHDTDEILREAGYSAAEIAQLHEKNAVR